MFEQVLNIARNTFIESIRQPIFLVVLCLVVMLLVFNLSASYTLSDDDKLLIDLGLSMMFIGGIFLAAFTAAGVVSREIENKTVLTVISKPISRPAFILGKYLGVLAAMILAFWVWAIIFLMSVRHEVMSTAADHLDQPVWTFSAIAFALALGIAVWGNYFYNWVFTSRFVTMLAAFLTVAYLGVLVIDKEWAFQSITHEFTQDNGHLVQVLIAMLGVFQGLAVLCAIAIACSTRLGQVMTLMICLGIYMVGLMSDYMFGQRVDTEPAWWLFYALPPNIGFMWLADALTQRSQITGMYILMVSGYVALYILAMLSLATALFQTRETG